MSDKSPVSSPDAQSPSQPDLSLDKETLADLDASLPVHGGALISVGANIICGPTVTCQTAICRNIPLTADCLLNG